MVGQTPNYMTQICAGPALESYKVMNEIIALSNKIEAEMAHLSELEMQVQGKSARAAGKAEETAAHKEASSLYCQMGNSFAGTIMSGVSLKMQTSGENASLDKEATEESAIAKQQQGLLSLKRTPPTQAPVGQTAGSTAAPRAAWQDEIAARKADLIAHGGESDYQPSTTEGQNHYGTESSRFHAGDTKNGRPSLDQDAINDMTPAEHAAFKAKLEENIKRHETNANRVETRKNSNIQSYQTVKQVGTDFSGAFFQIGQAQSAIAKGQAQQDQTIQQYVSQSSQAAVSQTQGLMATFFQKVAEAIQAAKAAGMAYSQ